MAKQGNSVAKSKRPKQFGFFKNTKSDYGGDLQRTRAGRAHGRPLSKKSTMHLVLRSTKARGEWSFLRSENRELIRVTLAKFAKKYGVRVLSMANVGNHLHLQMRITNRSTYNAFIRATTGAIAKGVMRRPRRTKVNDAPRKFWDCRPFSRIAATFREYLNLKDYVRLNQLEANGYGRETARDMVFAESVPICREQRNRPGAGGDRKL